jgi:outer membrane receptor protein involved in Fe transport
LNLSANLAYTHAYLTVDAPGIGGNAGDELPDVPRFAANVSADYDFPITNSIGGFVGASFRYQGDRRTLFVTGTPPLFARPVMPAYETVDLRAGVNRGGLELAVYVKNLNDSHGLNTVSSLNFDGFSPPLTGAVIQPRTYGISISDKF